MVIAFLVLIYLLVCSACGNSSSGSPVGSSFDTASADPIQVAWNAPTVNADGTSLTDLAGYVVHYGPSATNYVHSVDVGMSTDVSLSSLSPGVWCIAVTAYDVHGNESDYSNETCITV